MHCFWNIKTLLDKFVARSMRILRLVVSNQIASIQSLLAETLDVT